MQYILYTLALVVLSFYFFPFEFTFMPGINTKMAMAGIGLAVLAIQFAKKRKVAVDNDFLHITILAGIVSLIGFISVTYNGTHDYTYATYIVSMLVWLSAANLVLALIRTIHGHVNVTLICDYLIVLCVVQCSLALIIDGIPSVKEFVDSFLSGQGFMGKNEHRLYGIGCSLDVAGTRFCAILLMCIYQIVQISSKQELDEKRKFWHMLWYLSAFMFISIVGNMIARTTTIGVALAFLYLLILTQPFSIISIEKHKLIWRMTGIMLFVAICVSVLFYNISPVFKYNLRFAFEGFFSLAEKGTWEVHSNEILKNMVVFPDEIKTWIIGNGYFDNPYDIEPYYTGVRWRGFYQNTDIGYLRFIFYFGIFGLITFIAYFIKVALTCRKRLPEMGSLFLMLLLLNFTIWCKVSTDIFLVFALFLCMPYKTEPEKLKIEENITSDSQTVDMR